MCLRLNAINLFDTLYRYQIETISCINTINYSHSTINCQAACNERYIVSIKLVVFDNFSPTTVAK